MKTKSSASWKLHLEFAEFSELSKVQAKLNQWKTKGELIKYRTSMNDKGVLFEVLTRTGA
jgi:hypothetical protein